MAIAVIGLGAGGHARVIIEILQMNSNYEIIGLLDPKPELKGHSMLGVPVIGDDKDLQQFLDKGVTHFFIGLGGTGNNSPRQKLYQNAVNLGFLPVTTIHPQAILSPSASIGAGVMVMAGAIVNTCAQIGENVIINTGAIVEHDCVIENHVHIASGARLASTVHVGEKAHIGAGATVRQCITIGAEAVVGAGAVVVKDVRPGNVVVGIPARVVDKSGSTKSHETN